MSEELFPEARSVEILGELSAWTSVADVMVAARIIEARTVPGDQPESLLIMPLEHLGGASLITSDSQLRARHSKLW